MPASAEHPRLVKCESLLPGFQRPSVDPNGVTLERRRPHAGDGALPSFLEISLWCRDQRCRPAYVMEEEAGSAADLVSDAV